ncbi:MAG: trypsin-like peptidase domain-containing protein [Pirellulaceae bacterium]
MRWGIQIAALHVLCFTACLPGFATEPNDLQPLRRFYNTASKQHLYTISEAEANAWRQQADVEEEHVIGRVAPQKLQGTARLYRATFNNNTVHSYFTGREDAAPAGSLDKANFEVYVWIHPGDGRIPVYYNSLSRGTDQYYSYILEHVRRYSSESESAKQGLRSSFSDSIAFWVYPPLPEQLAARPRPPENTALKKPTVESATPEKHKEGSQAKSAESLPSKPVLPALQDPHAVVFTEVLLTFPVTSLDITDDGRWLVISHQLGDVVTVYDVLNSKIDRVIHVQSPRTVVCQGDRLFVANFGLGTIGVYSISQGWQLIDELQVPKKQIIHLSIADGPDNHDVLLVTCHGEGRQASYQDTHNYKIDVERDTSEKIATRPLLLASKDGRYVIGVQSFGVSGGGSLSGFYFDQFLTDERRATQLFNCQIENDTFSQEAYRKGTWFSQTQVMSGVPLQSLNEKPFSLVIPDFSQDIFYELDGDMIRARQMNTALSEIDMRRMELPEPFRDFNKLCNWRKRTREYFLDLPKAYTHGDRLHLFFTSAENGRLLTATTNAFRSLETLDSSGERETLNTPSIGESQPASVRPIDPNTSVLADELQQDFPSYLVAGQMLRHQFKLPPAGRIELASQLTDAELSPTGEFRWRVPNQPNTMATLKLRLQVADGVKFVRITSEILHPELLNELGGDLSKWSEHQRIDLDVPAANLRVSRAGTHLLLLRDKRLSVLSRDGCKIEKTFQLPKTYSFVDLRGEYLIAASPREVDVIDARNMRVQQTMDLTKVDKRIDAVTDLALHPVQRECYLCVKILRDELRYTLLKVDEVAGSIKPTNVPATWAKVSPDGQLIYIGYKDLFKSGISLQWNPGGLFAQDRYGNIDILMQLQIEQGLNLEQAVVEAGGNGKGIRLSAGGRRVVYLSHIGDPKQKGSLVGWNCNDFDGANAIYPTLRCSGYLQPLLPSATSSSRYARKTLPHCTDLRTGSADQLLIPPNGIGRRRSDIWSLADGKHLVLLCGGQQGLYTRSITIKWAAEDLLRTETVLTSQNRSLDAFEPIATGQLHSLQPANSSHEPVTAQEIGRKYMPAVVSIRTPTKIGSGFFVGKSGYVLTNAHVVRASELIEVLLTEDGGSKVELSAKIVRIDTTRDLALLKVEVEHEVPVVRLAPNDSKLESGEPVTVIGSPGLGDRMLEQTMTTGIVSNPQRFMDNVELIQTDAPVNPGNSGGPMFDGRGQVIGLISQKARIDGTGFAIPANVLRNFLETTERKTKETLSKNEFRTFRDRTESFSIEARVSELNVAEGMVVLESRDGRQVSISLDRLSEADRDALLKPK